MAAANKRRNRRHAGSTGGLPGWAMLTIGLIIGLFVAFLVYLDDLDPITSDVATVDPDEAPAETEEDERPRFEFYSILPELEVVIPEFRRPREEPEVDEGITPPPAGVDPVPEIDGEGRYFLQVGSFQQADQAERLKAEVALLGLDVQVRTVRVNGDQWHRVRVGPFSSTEGLRGAQDRLRDNGIDYLVLRDRS